MRKKTRNGQAILAPNSKTYKTLITPCLVDECGMMSPAHRIAADLYNGTIVSAAFPEYTAEDHLDAAHALENDNFHRTAGAHYAAAGHYRLDHNKKHIEEIFGAAEYPSHRKR